MKWLRPGLPAGAILISALLWLTAVPASAVGDNVVAVEPGRILVAPGGSFTVQVRTDPPSQTLAVWIVEVAFDSDVLSAESRDCNPFDPPGGSTGIAECQVVDTDGDETPDTAKILGAVLFNSSGDGLKNVVSLADITFEVIGGPQDCSDLRVRTVAFTDPDGKETGALVQDGRICVAGEAPASGTADPTVVAPRTSEPTPQGGETIPPATGGGNPTGPVETNASGEPVETNASGEPVETNASGEPIETEPGSDTSPGQTGPSGTTGSGSAGPSGATDGVAPTNAPDITDDDGGTSAIVWVVLGLAVLGVAAGGAWALVRLRRPPTPPAV